MLDILAVLDAAIDDLAPAASPRSTRRQGGPDCRAGTSNRLKSKGLPVVPVVPVAKEGYREPTRQASTASRLEKKIESRPNECISFSTGNTGTTGNPEDFCGVRRTRDGQTARELTDNTGTGRAIHLDHLDQLDPERPPGDVPPRRWTQFIADATAFRSSGFADQAKALGWTDADLFGCDEERPFARIDCLGLLWLMNGDRLLALTAETAVIETKGGSRLTFRKRGRLRG
jgi:hypothetical protein